MKNLLLLSLAVLTFSFAGCASKSQFPEEGKYSSQYTTDPIYCSGEDCDVKWKRARQWIFDHTTSKIGKESASEIEGELDNVYTSYRVRKLPAQGNQYKIVMNMECGGSPSGCTSTIAQLKDSFIAYVSGPQQPMQQKAGEEPELIILSPEALKVAREFGEKCRSQFANGSDQVQCVTTQCQNTFRGTAQQTCADEALAAIGLSKSGAPAKSEMTIHRVAPPKPEMTIQPATPPAKSGMTIQPAAPSAKPGMTIQRVPPSEAAKPEPTPKQEAMIYQVDSLYTQAEAHYQEGRYEQAILEYQQFIDANPKDPAVPNAMLQQSNALLKLGRKDEANVFYMSLIDKYPNSPEAASARIKLKEME